MTKIQRWGLVAAGPVSRSGIARVPHILDHLGPVKSDTLRVASRVCGLLRAGYPVTEYQEIEECRSLVLCVPAASLDKIVAELTRAGRNWRRRTVILWNDSQDSSRLEPLAALGAHVASIAPLPGAGGCNLLVEGDAAAIRTIRSWVGEGETHITEVGVGKKLLYQAGVSLANLQVTLLAEACIECLREAGISPYEAQRIGEAEFARTLRGFFKGGRRGWRTLSSDERRSLELQWDKLAGRFPALAMRYSRAWKALT